MSEFVRSFKRLLGRAWFGLHRATIRYSKPRDGSHVVLIRADGLGDLLFSLPLIEAIRRAEAPRRTVLVCDAGAQLLLERLEIVDDLVPLDRRRYRRDPFYRWHMWEVLREVGADVAVNLQYHRSPTSDELLLATESAQTISMSGNDEMIADRDRQRSDRSIATVVDVPDHMPERLRYERLGDARGWPKVDWDRSYGAKLANIDTSDEDRSGGEGIVVAIAPGGSAAVRRWPVERWIELARGLQSDRSVRPVLVGGEMDRPLLNKIASSAGGAISIQIGGDALMLARILRKASLIVGIDAGISHLAARLGTPAVVILGGGHFSRYFPYGSARVCFERQDCYECNWRCHRDAVYCLTEISVDQVMEQIHSQLDLLRRTGGG